MPCCWVDEDLVLGVSVSGPGSSGDAVIWLLHSGDANYFWQIERSFRRSRFLHGDSEPFQYRSFTLYHFRTCPMWLSSVFDRFSFL